MPLRARLLALVAAFAFPALGQAQDTTAAHLEQAPVMAAPVVAGPTLDASATAFRVPSTSSDSDALVIQRRQSLGKPVAMMVVGGAAIVLGAVIGDAPGTLFMIGGAVALLYGLYQYTK